MNCNEARELLPDFLFGELGEDRGRALAEHLEVCSACRREAASLREAAQALEKLPEVEPARRMVFVAAPERASGGVPGLLERILPVRLRRWGFRAALAAGLAALAVFGTRVQYHSGRLTVSIGRQAAAEFQPPGQGGVSPQLVSLLGQWRDENLYLTTRLITESERRQRELLVNSLNRLASQIQRQRMEDLQFVADNLLRIQRTNEVNFDRTNSLLQGLVQFAAASYQPGKEK